MSPLTIASFTVYILYKGTRTLISITLRGNTQYVYAYYIYVCACTYARIYMHTNTHTHIYIYKITLHFLIYVTLYRIIVYILYKRVVHALALLDCLVASVSSSVQKRSPNTFRPFVQVFQSQIRCVSFVVSIFDCSSQCFAQREMRATREMVSKK
jgi:hypothetical protein